VRNSLPVLIAAAILTMSCSPSAERVAAQNDRGSVDKMRADYQAAFKSGLADRVTSQYTSDGVLLYPNQPVITGTTAIREYYQKLFADFTPTNFEILSAEVVFGGDWAIDRGTYKLSLTAKAGGAVMNDEGKYLVMVLKQPDGSYKVARDIDNSSVPLSPAEEPKKKQ
jgi:ketosteroid isomerase-like protein